jgi:hypothetical protein
VATERLEKTYFMIVLLRQHFGAHPSLSKGAAFRHIASGGRNGLAPEALGFLERSEKIVPFANALEDTLRSGKVLHFYYRRGEMACHPKLWHFRAKGGGGNETV